MHKIELSILEYDGLKFRNNLVVGISHEFVEMISDFSRTRLRHNNNKVLPSKPQNRSDFEIDP
jgi:hypothetical protein